MAGLERDREVGVGLLVEARAHLGVHAGHPLGGVPEAVAVGVLADGLEDLRTALAMRSRSIGVSIGELPAVDGQSSSGTGSRLGQPQVPPSGGAASGAAAPARGQGGGHGTDHLAQGRLGRHRALGSASARRRHAHRLAGGVQVASEGRRSMPVPLSMSPNTSARSASSSVSFSTSAVARPVERGAVGGQDRPGLVVGAVDQPADLVVDEAGHLVGVVGLVARSRGRGTPRPSLPSCCGPSRSLMP